MKTLAEQIAEQMNSIMDSSDHKSVFGKPALGKFASKKDDEKEEDEDKKKDEKKDKKEEKKDKKAQLNEAIEGIARISATLDDLGFVRASLHTIKALETISKEAGENPFAKKDDDKDEDKDEDKKDKKDKKDEGKEDKKEDKKDDDKSKADDSSFSDDHPPTPPVPNASFKGYPSDEDTHTMGGGSAPTGGDTNDSSYGDDHMPKYDHEQTKKQMQELSDMGKALDSEQMFEGVEETGDAGAEPVDNMEGLAGPTVPEIGSADLLAALEAAGIELTPDQKIKLESLEPEEAQTVVAKLIARKLEKLS